MIVIKFGGTSVGDADRVANAIDIVAERRHLDPIVVVSALSGVTNDLVAATEAAREGNATLIQEIVERVRARHEEVAMRLVQQKFDFYETFQRRLEKQIDEIHTILRGVGLLREVTPRAHDRIVSIGEKLSSVLFTYSMMMRGLPGEHVESEDVIRTTDAFGCATPLMDETAEAAKKSLLPPVARKHIPVMGGFIGRSSDGATTTLGRNGSDYSAAIVAAAIGADEVQIWTDVDGLLTCDPRFVPCARVIDHLSHEEAAELASFGAKLHPRTLEPAVDAGIPIRVLNTQNAASAGTLITRDGPGATAGPRSIARKRNVTLVQMTSSKMLGAPGFLAKLFEVFGELGISIDLIATSEVSVSVTLDERKNVDELRTRLAGVADVQVHDAQCIIAVVGRNLLGDALVAARVFEAMRGIPMHMLSMGRSGLNLSIVIDDAHSDRAIQELHQALFEQAVAA